MIAEAFVRASNSLLLVLDPSCEELPETMGGGLVAATDGCIAVGTLAEFDGATRLRLMLRDDAVVCGDTLPSISAYEGWLVTPSGIVTIASILGDVFVEAAVSKERTAIQVLVNDLTEPDDIVVVMG